MEASEPGVVQYCEAGLIKVGLGGDGDGWLSGEGYLAGLIRRTNACKEDTRAKMKRWQSSDTGVLFQS